MNGKKTRQKAVILDAIQGPNVHLSAEQVLQKVQQEDPGIGLATVYRNLNAFCEEHLIQKISGRGYSYFDGNPVPHDHLHCRVCGRIFDVPDDYDAGMDARAEKNLSCQIDSHSTTYEGICQECLKKQKN